MLFEISKNLSKSFVTHILLANICEKFTRVEFAKLNPREMLKTMIREKFLPEDNLKVNGNIKTDITK